MGSGLLYASTVAVPLLLGAASPSSEPPNASHSLPPYAMPMTAFQPSNGSHLPAAPGDLLEYHGGAVISNVKVYQVNWGPNVWSQVVSGAPNFFSFITNSAYLDWLSSQYDTIGRLGEGNNQTSAQHIGRGSFGKSITITPQVATGNPVTNDQIAQELALQLQAGNLPAPDIDGNGYVNALYFFMFPPGITIYLEGAYSCQSFGGYHFTIQYQGKAVPYAVMPDCGQNDWNLAQVVMSHETVEAITDATVGLNQPAWNSDQYNGQEIGDLCNLMAGQIGSYVVQLEYSNHDMACVVDSSFRLPVCNGTTQPPSCRECSATDNGMACSGATPVCETSTHSSKFGQCVSCTAMGMECTGAMPICDSKTDTCRACTSDKDCKAPTPACATDASDPKVGTCVQCTNSSYCSGTMSTPVCDTTSDMCVQCATNADCQDPSKPNCVNNGCQSGTGGGDDGGSDDGGNGFTVTNGPSGCGCSVVGSGGGIGALAMAAGLAFGAGLRRRRRRHG